MRSKRFFYRQNRQLVEQYKELVLLRERVLQVEAMKLAAERDRLPYRRRPARGRDAVFLESSVSTTGL
jgi:hypothetical protein